MPSTSDACRTTLNLFSMDLDLMRQNVQRDHPEAKAAEIDRRLREWLQQRPGAESGDCAGLVGVSARLA